MDGSDVREQEWQLITRALLTQWEATLLVTTMVLAAHRAMAAVIAGAPQAREADQGAGGDDGAQG